MDLKDQVRNLVRQVVEDYVKGRRPIAILLAYQSADTNKVIETVHSLKEAYDCTLLLANEWKEKLAGASLEDLTVAQLKEILESTSLLLIPTASFTLLAKLAHTVDDEKASWLAIQYQLKGKSVVIANDETRLTVEQQILAPHTVQARIQSYVKQIQADKVKWVPLSKLSNTVAEQMKAVEEKKSLILAKHVVEADRQGLKALPVPANSQLTPSAKDLARELKIVIQAKGG